MPSHPIEVAEAANSNRQKWLRFILTLTVLATTARLAQLAVAPGMWEASPTANALDLWEASPTATSHGITTSFHSQPRIAVGDRSHKGFAGNTKSSRFDAELAKLYSQCPTAAVISLTEATTTPEKLDALLPPFRQTAARESDAMQPVRQAPPPAVPRIRYPRPLEPRGEESAEANMATPSSGHGTLRVATNTPPTAEAPTDDWLVDPNEWYTPEERARLQETSAADVAAPDAPAPLEELNESVRSDTAAPPAAAASESQLPKTGTSAAPVPTTTEEHFVPEDESNSPPAPTTAKSAPPVEPTPDIRLPDPTTTEETSVDSVAPQSAAPSEELLPPPALPARPQQQIFPPPSEAPSAPHGAAPPASATCGVDPHLELFAKNAYPSARECATCHEEIYHQWSVSAHAYAAVSPMFHKFEQKLNDLSHGTVGYFCMRCHAPVAVGMFASRDEPLWNLPEVAREGITCIACHRVQYVYGKSNGERRIEEGSIFAPVMGGVGGDGVAETIHRKAEFKVKTSPDEPGPGQNMHVAGIYFDPLTRSEACTPCHQVAVHPGIKLEVVWEQYRASPACKKGIQCQDCHMGRVPGLPLGYEIGAVASVAGKTVNDHRKKSNHTFYGPNYSIAHPGVFPFHLKAGRWTMDEWLLFDWRAGWGTDEFEDRVADGSLAASFPRCWAEVDDRYDAREIIDENLKKLAHKREIRRQVMENGSHVEGPFFDSPLCRGQDVKFHYIVTNTNEGHNLLTASLGAQPQLWANVVLVGPDGCRLWETGYTDSSGDLANIHSMDVRHGRVPYDRQLFNLQTMFLITGAKGTDREFFVPVNVDIDQLPFIRPGAQPISVINHPPFIRMESQSLAPLGSRKVPYRIPGELIRQPGKYRLSFRMRSRAEPIYFMRFCEATPEMERMMNEWMIDVHPMSVEFYVR